MSPPIVLCLYKYEFDAVVRLAHKGDANAAKALTHLWDDYHDLHCFLCERLLAHPIRHQLLRERGSPKVLLVPLCPGCHHQPTMPRINACLGMMKKMHAARREANLDFGQRVGER
jgi:hypothetical protein